MSYIQLTEVTEDAMQQAGSSSTGPSKYHNATFDDLLLFAAEDALGEDIELQEHLRTKRDLTAFKDSLSIRILSRQDKPTAVGRTTVDVYAKEYKNYGVPDDKNPGNGDITKVFVYKTCPTATGRNYRFTSNQGIVWNMYDDFGLQMLAMGVSGGSMGLYGNYHQNITSLGSVASTLGASLGFTYNQEDNITIPAGKKVHVATTTYITEYHLRYKLEFCIPKMRTIFVKYRKPCCGCLCGCNKSSNIHYWTMVYNLPEFREDSQYAYFTQEGILSWLGESCEVNKTEAPVRLE